MKSGGTYALGGMDETMRLAAVEEDRRRGDVLWERV